jgi:hypothetical protein
LTSCFASGSAISHACGGSSTWRVLSRMVERGTQGLSDGPRLTGVGRPGRPKGLGDDGNGNGRRLVTAAWNWARHCEPGATGRAQPAALPRVSRSSPVSRAIMFSTSAPVASLTLAAASVSPWSPAVENRIARTAISESRGAGPSVASSPHEAHPAMHAVSREDHRSGTLKVEWIFKPGRLDPGTTRGTFRKSFRITRSQTAVRSRA